MACLLFVDDDNQTLETSKKKATLSGYGVLSADLGDVVFVKVPTPEPDLILQGMGQSQTDGFELGNDHN